MLNYYNIFHKAVVYFVLSFYTLAHAGASLGGFNDKEVVTIPAGEFTMGCNLNANNCLQASSPAHKVFLDTFQIDKYPVTFRRYNECKEKGPCTSLYEGSACNAKMPWNTNHPINCVNYKQAETFCQWDGGKRLPTEAEWEKAARGIDQRSFPWGEQAPNCSLMTMNKKENGNAMGPGCGTGRTQEVNTKPQGASAYGVMDMEGNLFEWTADWFDENYFARTPYRNPKGPEQGEHKVLKGSSWLNRSDAGAHSSTRSGYSPLGQGYVVGFRCAKTI